MPHLPPIFLLPSSCLLYASFPLSFSKPPRYYSDTTLLPLYRHPILSPYHAPYPPLDGFLSRESRLPIPATCSVLADFPAEQKIIRKCDFSCTSANFVVSLQRNPSNQFADIIKKRLLALVLELLKSSFSFHQGMENWFTRTSIVKNKQR